MNSDVVRLLDDDADRVQITADLGILSKVQLMANYRTIKALMTTNTLMPRGHTDEHAPRCKEAWNPIEATPAVCF
jgi:hypothetical protein